LLDGWVAEHTQTKHAVGEFLDGAADKIATIVMLGLFLGARIAPWWILGLMFLPHLIIGVFSLASWARHIRLHPSRIGKYTMAAVWVVLIGYVLLFALQIARAPFTVLLGSLALVVAGAGFYVASSYTRRQD
jgi:phosphatidylglycerophosphate synthase